MESNRSRSLKSVHLLIVISGASHALALLARCLICKWTFVCVEHLLWNGTCRLLTVHELVELLLPSDRQQLQESKNVLRVKGRKRTLTTRGCMKRM